MAGKMLAKSQGVRAVPMTTKADVAGKAARAAAESKAKMSLPNWKPAQKPAWKPQKGIPDQAKVKNIGVGWGGEKPRGKKK